MRKNLSVNDVFNTLRLSIVSLKLTELRKDILRIMIQAKKPLSAAEVLLRLKKRRETAEPSTVYRVIEYLLKKNVIHKIASENKYILCSQLNNSTANNEHGLIFICKKCLTSCEVGDEYIISHLKSLAQVHKFSVDCFLIEVSSICKNCKKK